MISVLCLVDNSAKRGSALWAEHGLSFVITTPKGKILFDTGQSGVVLEHNAEQLRMSLHEIDALAFSHAHYDHTGGMERFLAYCSEGTPLYAHPDLLLERFPIKGDLPTSIGLRLTPSEISQRLDMRMSNEPHQILPGVWTSGEITKRDEPEGRSLHHFIQENGIWLPDPYQDDQALILEGSSGLVVLCGCCHAGILNTLTHVQGHFDAGIQAIVGGLHLQDATWDTISHTISSLEKVFRGRIPKIFTNHCSGERAIYALYQAFGDLVQPCPAGTILQFH